MKDNVIDYFDYKEDFNTTKTFYSDSIKNPILEGFYTLGIDEAGRGPVLGPMVYACCFWNDSLDKEINNDYKFDDSKKLSDKVRRNIFERMKNDKRLFFIVNIITPEFLSKNMG